MGEYCSCSEDRICTFTATSEVFTHNCTCSVQAVLHWGPSLQHLRELRASDTLKAVIEVRVERSGHGAPLFRTSVPYSHRPATIKSRQLGALNEYLKPFQNPEDLKKADDVNRVHKDFWQVVIKNYYRFKTTKDRGVCHPERILPSVETVSKRLFFNEIMPTTICFSGVP